MNLLFVNACVRPQSRTLELCREYISLLENRCDVKLTELDLGKMHLQSFDYDMLCRRDNDIARSDFSSDRYEPARAFAAADMVLIGAPYWDYSFPSSLKVFFEHVSVNTLTFRYEGADCISLCKADRLCYITTAGGYIGSRNSGEQYISDMCRVFGIEKTEFFRAEGLDIYGNDAKEIMKKVKEEIRESLRQE
ncbi:MAG: NAD(P)H-dependent oxidoreductase [Ruminiclostridium sp.]|nr:NAD(P)H-dependent oxidoreductase [Ruminiclostridium sp.]